MGSGRREPVVWISREIDVENPDSQSDLDSAKPALGIEQTTRNLLAIDPAVRVDRLVIGKDHKQERNLPRATSGRPSNIVNWSNTSRCDMTISLPIRHAATGYQIDRKAINSSIIHGLAAHAIYDQIQRTVQPVTRVPRDHSSNCVTAGPRLPNDPCKTAPVGSRANEMPPDVTQTKFKRNRVRTP